MARIQIITIIINLLFVFYISRLIIKNRLREEYAIIWSVCTLIIIVFSVWRDGLAIMSKLFGVYEPPNLVFTAFIFVILVYLLHLSVVNSKLQRNVNSLSQEIALMKEKLKDNNEEQA